ncbi:MAG: HAMP domain-containing histidine kinase [Campylobacteraceae bacterium]|nr:HAMP domain-containing histidine kinase [Campylobacteraceae bacterium]
MSKRNKIYLVSLSLIVISALFMLKEIEDKEEKGLRNLTETVLIIKDLQNNVLFLRRNEKDFLLRHNEKYSLDFTKNYIKIQRNITSLINHLKKEKIDTSELLRFNTTVKEYKLLFKNIVETQKIFGLNENKSKYLDLRQTAHALLDDVKLNKKMLSDVLQLRRHEKDFLLRKDLKYRALFLKKERTIFIAAKNQKRINLLKQYKLKFLELVKLQEKIGLNENLGLMGKMRNSIHKSEKILDILANKFIKDIENKSVELINLTYIFIMILFVIVILIMTILVKFFMSESKINALNLLNNELSKTLNNLEKTQDKLIEAEKMASLGGLVAGVAHEINTPLGIALTGITYFDEISHNIHKIYETQDMTQEDFEKYLDESKDISSQVLKNIQRASDLVQSFKQVSVDQTSEIKREFYVKDYTNSIILSIHNQIKRTHITIENNIPSDVKINSYPGAFGQIITNLILNSLIHGYTNKDKGLISFTLKKEKNDIVLHYKDDGKGIKESDLPHIFEPFFTTRRGIGGTGLGLNILYNIVKKQFEGEISCKSKVNEGVDFEIIIPID